MLCFGKHEVKSVFEMEELSKIWQFANFYIKFQERFSYSISYPIVHVWDRVKIVFSHSPQIHVVSLIMLYHLLNLPFVSIYHVLIVCFCCPPRFGIWCISFDVWMWPFDIFIICDGYFSEKARSSLHLWVRCISDFLCRWIAMSFSLKLLAFGSVILL